MAVTENFLMPNSSSESGNAQSPLSPLRFLAVSRKKASHTSEARVKKDPRKKKRKHRIEGEPSHIGPGFDFEIDLPSMEIQQPSALDRNDDSSLVRAHKLATVLLNSGKMINSKFNVVDALNPADANGSGSQAVHISRAARNRTETVKAMISLKYHWMERAMQMPENQPNPHPGVEGIYNPLQVIRNRTIRARHNEPPPLVFRGLPLACNAFSSRSKSGGKLWKMLWGIELGELVNDVSWRLLHWRELRDPKGKLWFPDAPPAESKHSKSTSTSKNSQVRMHDTLFAEQESDGSLEDINVNMIPIEAARPSKLRLTKNLKVKAKKLYGNASGGFLTSDSDGPVNENLRSKSYESLSKVKIGRILRKGLSVTDESSAGDDVEEVLQKVQTPEITISVPKSSEGVNGREIFQPTQLPPVIVINNDTDSVSEVSRPTDLGDGPNDIEDNYPRNLLEVLFNPLHPRKNLDNIDFDSGGDELTPEENAKDVEIEAGPPPIDIEGQRMVIFAEKQSYLRKVLLLNYNYLTSVCQASIEVIKSSSDRILQEEFGPLFRDIININDSHLPAYENFYTGFVNEAKSLIHMANDNYAVKIDHLLSATDRSIGEINTSLSMDLRKCNEQLDKLNCSLFGSKVIDKLKNQDTSRFNDGSNYRRLYLILENTIVILLWLVWIVVNIYNSIAFVVKLLWRILMFFLLANPVFLSFFQYLPTFR